MTIAELKNQITANQVTDDMIIFNCDDKDSFLAFQYIGAIAKLKNLQIVSVDDLGSIVSSEEEMFETDNFEESEILYIYLTDKLECKDTEVAKIKNLIIVTDKFDKTTKSLFSSYIIDVPALEDWQIKDYVYSNLPKVNTNNLDWLCKMCQNNMSRIAIEVERLKVFSELNRDEEFKQFYHDGIYSDLTDSNMFTLTNALQRRDIDTIREAYVELKELSDSEMLFYTLLCTGFRNLIQVQLGKNVTSETVNGTMTDKQIYAISKIPRMYSRKQLIDIYCFLTDLSSKIRDGKMLSGMQLIDYIIVKILTI